MILSCICDAASVSAVCGVLSVAVTFALFQVAYEQLGGFNKTTRSDFFYKIKKEFLTLEARELIAALLYNMLIFEEGEDIEVDNNTVKKCPYYIVDQAIFGKIKNRFHSELLKQEIFGQHEIEFYLLDHIEQLSLLLKDRIIDLIQINEGFGAYIETIMENKAVKAHIEFYRNEKRNEKGEIVYDESLYCGAIDLNDKLKKLNSTT